MRPRSRAAARGGRRISCGIVTWPLLVMRMVRLLPFLLYHAPTVTSPHTRTPGSTRGASGAPATPRASRAVPPPRCLPRPERRCGSGRFYLEGSDRGSSAGSSRVRIRSAATSRSVCTAPLGQRTCSSRTRADRPRPKCTRGSLELASRPRWWRGSTAPGRRRSRAGGLRPTRRDWSGARRDGRAASAPPPALCCGTGEAARPARVDDDVQASVVVEVPDRQAAVSRGPHEVRARQGGDVRGTRRPRRSGRGRWAAERIGSARPRCCPWRGRWPTRGP